MQRYLWVKISDLDDYVSKFVHEFSERLIVCLPQTGQDGQGHAMRSADCILRVEVLNEGVKAIYGPRW